MKRRKVSRVLSLVLILTLLFAALPVTANAELADYDPAAVSVINGIITNNGLSYSVNDPENWDFAIWDDSIPAQLTALELSDKNLRGELKLTGITSLQSLSCSWNRLTSLDVSANTALVYLDCYYNKLLSLDVSKNAALEYLYCSSNKLTSLDVSKNTALEYLDCSDNRMTNLDMSKNTALQTLSCAYNKLTSISVSNNTALQWLDCAYNKLTSLNVKNNTALETLWCEANELVGIDVSKNTVLQGFDCSYNEITSLDVNKNTALLYLLCYNDQLTELDVSKNIMLQSLGCSGNLLTGLDVSGNTALEGLDCSFNQLAGLDVSKNISMKYLYCSYNQLTDLDVSKNTALEWLMCSDNGLTNLDVSNNPWLEFLDCSSNKLTSLNVSKNTLIEALDCSNNLLIGLDITGLVYLDWLNCYYNYMKSESDVVGYNSSRTLYFGFDPQYIILDRFVDLKDGAWYIDAVSFIVNYGLFKGVSDTEFAPDGNMSRAMFVEVLMRLSDKMGIDTSGDFSNSFKDVKSDAWYKDAVSWAVAKGLVNGYNANTFGPDDSITREQMAVMLIRFVDYAGITLNSNSNTQFSDAGKISSWAKDAVQRAAAGGLVSGIGDGRYDPLNTATRAQVAKLFGNLVNNYLKSTISATADFYSERGYLPGLGK